MLLEVGFWSHKGSGYVPKSWGGCRELLSPAVRGLERRIPRCTPRRLGTGRGIGRGEAHDLAAGTRFETTMQSVIGSCWVGIGQGSASWAGGLVLHHAGPVALFQA